MKLYNLDSGIRNPSSFTDQIKNDQGQLTFTDGCFRNFRFMKQSQPKYFTELHKECKNLCFD